MWSQDNSYSVHYHSMQSWFGKEKILLTFGFCYLTKLFPSKLNFWTHVLCISAEKTTYNVYVETGDMRGAGTDANVYITLYGEKDDSGRYFSFWTNDFFFQSYIKNHVVDCLLFLCIIWWSSAFKHKRLFGYRLLEVKNYCLFRQAALSIDIEVSPWFYI